MRVGIEFRASCFFALVLLVVLANPSTAEPLGWVGDGPWGGLVMSLSLDPDDPGRVLARTTGGWFLSGSSGDLWRRVAPPGARPVTRVSFAGRRLWSEVDGRAHSSADGREWRDEGPTTGRMVAFARIGKPGRILGAGLETVGKGRVRLFVAEKTEDGFRRIGQGVGTHPREKDLVPSFVTLLAHPKDPARLRCFIMLPRYTGEDARTLLLASGDGGKTWEFHTVHHALNAVAEDPADPEILYAVELFWGEWDSPLLRSDDGGLTFRTIGYDLRLTRLRTLAMIPGGKHLLLGSQKDVLLRTEIPEPKVAPTGKGLPRAQVSALATHPGRPKVVYAGTQCGVWHSEDGGVTFRRVSEGLGGLQAIGLAPFADGRLGCWDYLEGLRVSNDAGRSWTSKTPLRAESVHEVHAAGNTILVLKYPAEEPEHRASFDGGRTWRPVTYDGTPCGIGAGGELYARTSEGRLAVCMNGGEWKALAPLAREEAVVGRPDPAGPILLVHPAGVDLLDAGTGARESSVSLPDGAAVWTFLVPDPLRPGVAYLMGRDGEVFRLDVASKSVAEVHRREGGIHGGLAAPPGRSKRRFLGFGDGHIAVSDDEGKSWRPLDPPSPFQSLRGLAVVKGRLVAAGDGEVRSIALEELR